MTPLTKKLDHKWLGPYLVEKVRMWSAYCLKLPSSFGQTHLVFLVTLLRPYNADTITKCVQCDPPPPMVHNGVEEYKVEWILDSQVFRGRLEYLVCWKGYRIEEDKWKPAKDVKGSRWLVSEFHCRNPEAPLLVQLKVYTKYESCALSTISCSIGYTVVQDHDLFTKMQK